MRRALCCQVKSGNGNNPTFARLTRGGLWLFHFDTTRRFGASAVSDQAANLPLDRSADRPHAGPMPCAPLSAHGTKFGSMSALRTSFRATNQTDRMFGGEAGGPTAPKHHAARLRLTRAPTHYQRAAPARLVGIHCGDACQEHRSVFIDPARLIGIVLFCADARSTAPITAFEISH